MTLYVFYLLKNKFGDSLDVPILYAITDSKKMAEKFRRTRNESLFYYKKVVAKDKSLFDRSKEAYITEASFETNDGLSKKYVKIVCTWKEEQEIVLKSDMIFMSLVNNIILPINIFADKEQKILNKNQYHKIDAKSDRFCDIYKYDQLTMFVKAYGWLIKCNE